MKDMDMDRESIKSMLLEAGKQMSSFFEAQKAGKVIRGELRTVIIGSREQKMRYFPGKNENSTLYVDIHGGGFTWGTMEDGDVYCSELNDRFGFTVVSPEYPLTPHAEYPGILNTVYETIEYISAHAEEFRIDPDSIIIGGRSAGGNLAAAICQKSRIEGGFKIKLQVLDHPWLDLCGIIPDSDRLVNEQTLPLDLLKCMAIGYADTSVLNDICVSPLAASAEELRNLPPAVIQTCSLDCLEPDGTLYAEHLREAGVRVIHHCFEGALHGFTESDEPIGEEGRQWLLTAIEKMLIAQQ